MEMKELREILPEKMFEEVKKAFIEFKLTDEQKKKAAAKIAEIYKKSSYEPGEAIGAVTAQSVSEPGTQMSIDAKEKIIIKHKDVIAIQEIGEFTDMALKRLLQIEENGWEVADLSGLDIYVPSINQDEKIEWKRVLACSRHESPEKLLKIKTRSGREIVATDSHSFVVRKNNRIVAVSGKELKKGERIPSIKILPHNCINSINLKTVAEIEFSRARKILPENLPLNEVTGWIFGVYISEGNCVQNFASTFGLTCNEYDNFRGFARGHDIHINSTLLSAILAKTCGKGSRNKRIPDFALSANEKFVKGLLQAYFEGDGNISVERGIIRASSNSKDLIDGLALLLARFGIFSYKGKGKQFTLAIPAKHAAAFREKIGFVSHDKARRLNELCKTSSKQDYIEMVGGFDDLFVRTAKKLSYTTRYVNSFTKRQKIGKEALLRYIILFSNMAKEKGIDIKEELQTMKTMHTSDVVWDEIISLEYVESTSKYVYDLTVDGTQTFTTFEGIITHNTMRSYQLAGAVEIKVTLGLPRLIEIFDARKTPTTPAMAIHLQKSYNSKDKARRIATEIKEVRLADLVENSYVDLLNMQIEFDFNESILRSLNLNPNKIADVLKGLKYAVKVSGKKIIIKPKEEMPTKEMQKLKTKILATHIKGIEGITQAIIRQEEGEWIINTLGSNLEKVMQTEGVDAARTATNDINEIASVLGIEAARFTIVNEASKTLKDQGLDVDVRHILLIADVMTADGEVKPVGRYGVAGAKGSVLARANFEETIKHLTRASTKGEVDHLDSIVENVMINQVVPVGTGMFELVFKPPKQEK